MCPREPTRDGENGERDVEYPYCSVHTIDRFVVLGTDVGRRDCVSVVKTERSYLQKATSSESSVGPYEGDRRTRLVPHRWPHYHAQLPCPRWGPALSLPWVCYGVHRLFDVVTTTPVWRQGRTGIFSRLLEVGPGAIDGVAVLTRDMRARCVARKAFITWIAPVYPPSRNRSQQRILPEGSAGSGILLDIFRHFLLYSQKAFTVFNLWTTHTHTRSDT